MKAKEAAGAGAIIMLGLVQAAGSLLPFGLCVWVLFWSDWHWLIKLLAASVVGPVAIGLLVLGVVALVGVASKSGDSSGLTSDRRR